MSDDKDEALLTDADLLKLGFESVEAKHPADCLSEALELLALILPDNHAAIRHGIMEICKELRAT